MTNNQPIPEEFFQKVLTDRIRKINEVLNVKSKEYSREGDRLHNFNRGGDMTGKPREVVLHSFLLKHLISYFDIVDDIERGIYPTPQLIDEKLGDICTYIILQESAILHSLSLQKQENPQSNGRIEGDYSC
jgi:hypothetical protein